MPPPPTISHSMPSAFQRVHRVFHLRDGDGDLGFAIFIAVHVLHRTLVGLDASELETVSRVDGFGNLNNGWRCGHAATACAAVDLHEAFDLCAVLDRSCGQVSDVVRSSTQQIVRAPSFGMRARRSIFSGWRTWLETRTSLMPPRANTSASDTFWQQTPHDPPSFPAARPRRQICASCRARGGACRALSRSRPSF